MKRLYLTPEEKDYLREHALKENAKERNRIRAILLRSEGWTVPQISQALCLHQSTIIKHIEAYKTAGKLKNESSGSASHLTEEQSQKLIAHLEENTYAHHHQIVLYLKERFGVIYTVSGLHQWLHRHGFSYKKPKGLSRKVDAQLQKQFIEEYEQLKQEVVEEEPILFMDSVHPSQATKLAYGWIRTGKTKQVGTTASRTRIHIIGAIHLGHIAETITSQYGTINAQSIMEFMDNIRVQYNTKTTIHLILDKAGYHRSLLVAEQASKLHIKLHFLPHYSPNLNPIGRLWNVMNEQVRNNRFFKGAKDFKDAINGFFNHTLPRIGNSLNDRINDNFQILKT